MSQPIGSNLVTKIPQFSDDASIVEALKAYHYGIDNYTSQPIVDNVGVEGTIKKIKEDVAANSAAISAIGTGLIKEISASANPNTIIPQTSTTIPLTIRGASSQTGNLQQWQNSASADVSVVFSDGSFSTSAYISAGSVNKSSSTAIYAQTINKNHKGVVVRGSSLQSANLQEWQNSSGSALARVEPDGDIYTLGKMYSNNIEVVNLSDTQSLTNKSITIPSGETLEEFKVRNFQISSSTPSGGNDGDLWIQYD